MRQPQVTALQYHFHTVTQGDNRHHTLALGMRFMYCSWLLCSIVHYFVHYCALLCIYLWLLCMLKTGQWTRNRIMFMLSYVIVIFSWKYNSFLPIFVFNSVLGNIITSSWSKSIHYFNFSNHRILEVYGRTYIQLFERKDSLLVFIQR